MNSKRLFLKAAAWTAPVISTITMPVHAQATTPPPLACSFPDRMEFEFTSITTTDNWGGTELPTATWIPSQQTTNPRPDQVGTARAILELNGNNVTFTMQGHFNRTSSPSPFGAWGSTVTTGTIDRDTGMINITDIGATDMHPDSSNTPRPHYYVPEGPFSFSLPCGATSTTIEFTAAYLSSPNIGPFPTSGFNNVYTLEVI
jgi:hypothetical protein